MRQVGLGSAYRAVRIELRLRQADVAARARVSQQTVSRIERGCLGPISIDALQSVAGALEADLRLALRWRGAGLARLIDRRHAQLQDLVVALLVGAGWEVAVEETFNHYGECGSVDILAWRADVRALLIIEIKSELADVQDTVATLDRKVRVVPQVVRKTRGWSARSVAGILVLPDAKVARSAVASHAATMAAAFPCRTLDVRRWVATPSGDSAASGSLPIRMDRAMRSGGPVRRVRRRRAADSSVRRTTSATQRPAAGGPGAVGPVGKASGRALGGHVDGHPGAPVE